MEPRAVERFSETMAEEVEERAQTLSPYALDRTTGFYGICRKFAFSRVNKRVNKFVSR
jgi:hypothetical protein